MKKLPPNAATITASVLVGLGLLMIFLGWNGAAGVAAVDARSQFPYLISGGVFGLSLVAAGLMLARTFESRKDTRELGRQLERMAVALERMEASMQAQQMAEANVRETTAPPTMPPPNAPFERAR